MEDPGEADQAPPLGHPPDEVTWPRAVGVVRSGGDVPLGLHVVVHAAGASSVRLPLSSVEAMYGLDPHVLVGKVNPDPGHGRPAQPHRQSRSVFPLDRIGVDAACLLHVGMNVGDKAGLFAEVRRVVS